MMDDHAMFAIPDIMLELEDSAKFLTPFAKPTICKPDSALAVGLDIVFQEENV